MNTGSLNNEDTEQDNDGWQPVADGVEEPEQGPAGVEHLEN